MAIFAPAPKFSAVTSNGVPLSGGKLYTYLAGTTTPSDTYTTQAGTVANANPVILDSRGEANVWLATNRLYKFILKDSLDSTIYTVDNIGNTNGIVWCGTAGGTGDAITLTPSPAIAGNSVGQILAFIAAANNTGATTVNVSSIGATSLTKNGTSALVADDIVANTVVYITFDGTRYQILNTSTSFASVLTLTGGTMTGAITFAATGNIAKDLDNTVCDGRLTLSTGVPVPPSDVIAATTVYFTPFRGNRVSLWDGTNWLYKKFTQLSVAVPNTTTTPFDVFIYDNSGTPTLETVNWTSTTARATTIEYKDGVYCKTGDYTRRYLGTCCTTTVAGQCEDSANNRYVWNYYNRVARSTKTTFSANRSTNSTTYVELNTEIQAKFVVGVSEDWVPIAANGSIYNTGGADATVSGIGIDSATAATAGLESGVNAYATIGLQALSISGFVTNIAAGQHYVTLLGKTGSGTSTWNSATGTTTTSGAKTYLHVGVVG